MLKNYQPGEETQVITYELGDPILYHDGSAKSDEMRQALIDAGLRYDERWTGQPNTAVVVQDGNCYHSPESVRGGLVPRMQSYRL